MVLYPLLLMLPLGARRPQKPNLLPSSMDKGLMSLRRVADRGCQAPKLKLCPNQLSLTGPAEAVNGYYRRVVGDGGALDGLPLLLERLVVVVVCMGGSAGRALQTSEQVW